MYRHFIKRALDLWLSLMGLLVIFPLLILISLLLFVMQGGTPIFTQERAGLGGRPFRLFKFKTMSDARDADGRLLPDRERLTPIGKWVRASSLDELPQLVNVVMGHMSLIGPRPLHVRYVERYSARQRRRLDVRPGITGWAQVNGRNLLSWEERFELDVFYVDHCSARLDGLILLKTIGKVLGREGITSADAATMKEFMGEKGAD